MAGGLFNVNVNLAEEQWWYYLTDSWRNSYLFPCVLVNVKAWLEFILASYEVVVHVSHLRHENSPQYEMN